MLIVGLVILGLAFGSFVNALVWRVYQQALPRKQRKASDNELSIMKGRSMCTHCKHTLAWYDLLPVISWLSLRGACRYCRKPISWQYPLVELLTAALFVVSFVCWPTELLTAEAVSSFVIWLSALVGLVALIIYDARWMLLPNRIVFPLLGLAVIDVLIRTLSSVEPLKTVGAALGGLLVAGGIFYVLFQISDGKWIGGGDVKLGFVLGLLLGEPVLAFMMLFFASLLGLVAALLTVISRNATFQAKIPFGPFLIIATIATKLFGPSLWSWYQVHVLFY